VGVILPRLGAKVGDQITLTTVQNQTVSGQIITIDQDDDGGVVRLAIIDDPNRDDPVWVRGDLIALWRFGRPVVQQVPMVGQNGLQPVPLTQEMLRQLKGR
jgi:hypothetical protein